MKKDINQFFVNPNSDLKSVMGIIDNNGYGVALVIDENQKLLGLVTDGDIRRAIIKGTGLNIEVKEVMNTEPSFVKQGFNIEEIIGILSRKSIEHIPVLGEDKKVLDILMRDEFSNLLKNSAISLFNNKDIGSKQQKILIVGGAGYVGSVLAQALLKKGYTVRALDTLFYGSSSLDELNKHENFSFVKGDIGNVETKGYSSHIDTGA